MNSYMHVGLKASDIEEGIIGNVISAGIGQVCDNHALLSMMTD